MASRDEGRGTSERTRAGESESEPLGGADAVEKTTYVVGEGTDPRARKGTATGGARISPPGRLAIVIAVLVALVALAYIVGIAS